MKAVTAGEIVNAGPGRDPAQARAEIIAAAIVQIPEQALVVEAQGRQPAIETQGVEFGMRGRQPPLALPDAYRGHGKGRAARGLLHRIFEARILLQRALAHALHGQQAFLPVALEVQPLLRAVA